MKTIKSLWILIIPAGIFAALSGVLLLAGAGLESGQVFPILSGLLAWVLLLFEILLAVRPKFLERVVGLPELYAVHGVTGILILLLSFTHARAAMAASSRFAALSFVRPTGSLSTLLFLIAVVTGALVLSGLLARRFRLIARLQKKRRRETALLLHGLSALAVLLLFAHMMAVDVIRANALFCALTALLTLLTEGIFIAAKIKSRHTPQYTLTKLTRRNKNVFDLELTPADGKPLDYQAGQYIFLTFIHSALPKQSHPFSISSAPEPGGPLVLTIKESGDYTCRLPELKVGDAAVLEGPYGHFYKAYDCGASTPLVFLAGGIGVTPMFGLLRTQVKTGHRRKMILLWSLADRSDLFALEELEAIRQRAPDFSYFITLSREKTTEFGYGRLSRMSLETSGVLALQGKGDYFLCGPLPMMRDTKALLLENGISSTKIHLEEFSF